MTLFPMAIITLFWKDHIGLSLTEILVLQGFFSLSTLAFEYPSGYLSDRLGYRFSLNLASLLGICGWGWYLFAGSFWEVLIAELLLGASYAFISGSDSALLYETLREDGNEHRYAQYEGRQIGLAQAGEAAGAVFAGVLYAFFPLLPFLIQVLVWILALGLTTTHKDPPRARAPEATSHLAEAWGTVRYTFRDNRRLRAVVTLATVLGLASY
ncbi:MFS transporter, partial [Geoalkalibacter halelectricus]|uniref:MFS transporter n=1 Tax=Geoalkalibacter halelectricus TaxID=2847045 RepID=UPI003D214FC4